MERILIVEDNKAISNLIKTHLSMSGYDASAVFNGEDAVELVNIEFFDLVILDLMLPKLDGEKVMDKIKGTGIPIIILSSKSNLIDKVNLLRMGADDYITKPFESVDLIARVGAVLRRYKKTGAVLTFEDLTIYEDKHRAYKGDEVLRLTPKEYELLLLLVKNKSKVLTREDILSSVWGYTFSGGTRTVDIHIQRLRKKLNLQKQIQTVVKVGYILESESDEK